MSVLKDIKITINNLNDFWFAQAINGDVYENIYKNGFKYDLRKEMELDALSYISKLEANNLVLEDRYLENYLYSLMCMIYPTSLNDGRSGLLNVIIIKDSDPNAFICSNGSMFLTTGLLTTISSEEELIATMAHEISHFALDHSVINVIKSIQRQKSAEFWAAFATSLAAASEIYYASQNSYYVPGAVTYSTAVLSSILANEINSRLGLSFSKEQEVEADNCAIELLKQIKIDPSSLSTVLDKIRNVCILNGDYFSISGEGTHPSITERITNIGPPKEFNSSNYDKIFSSVISQTAFLEYNKKHFQSCQNLVNRNINSGVPTEEDYALKAMTNLYLYNTNEKNSEALELINKAKLLKITSINLDKQEALILIRLHNNQNAIEALEKYLKYISQEYLNLDKLLNENYWAATKEVLDHERDWTSRMIYKLKNI